MKNPALKYAEDVIAGEIMACQHTIKSCVRFIADLKRTDIIFSDAHYQHAVNFIQELPHTVGKYQGSKFLLEPWQHFIIANLFGWLRADSHVRRFTRAYVEVPRKNGKSTLASAICLYGLIADGEAAAQVYSVATKLDQASIVFEESYRQCNASKWLIEGGVEPFFSKNNRVIRFDNSIYKPLEWNPEKQDGLNTHFAIVDEYHAHQTDEAYNVIRNSMGARVQPMLFTITTAGFRITSPCYKHRQHCVNVLNGRIQDDDLFTIIYTLDETDDWKNPYVWPKANPNWGISVRPEFVQQALTEAKQSGTKEVEFKTKLLNVWTDAADVWIKDEDWRSILVDNDEAEGECYAGLDLASVSDFTALSLFWPKTMYMKTYYFLPEDALRSRNDQAGDSIRQWARDKYIITTPGNVQDYEYIYLKILELQEVYDFALLAYDKWNSNSLIVKLEQNGVDCAPYRQTISYMSPPTKEIERLIRNKTLIYQTNPVTRWMIANVSLEKTPEGNIKINKKKSADKVDGPVSMVMALGSWMATQQEQANSVEHDFYVEDI